MQNRDIFIVWTPRPQNPLISLQHLIPLLILQEFHKLKETISSEAPAGRSSDDVTEANVQSAPSTRGSAGLISPA